MLVDLDKQDIITLIRGTSPSYELMNDPIIDQLGVYSGGFKDEWNWNYVFPDLSIEILYNTYLKLKRN